MADVTLSGAVPATLSLPRLVSRAGWAGPSEEPRPPRSQFYREPVSTAAAFAVFVIRCSHRTVSLCEEGSTANVARATFL